MKMKANLIKLQILLLNCYQQTLLKEKYFQTSQLSQGQSSKVVWQGGIEIRSILITLNTWESNRWIVGRKETVRHLEFVNLFKITFRFKMAWLYFYQFINQSQIDRSITIQSISMQSFITAFPSIESDFQQSNGCLPITLQSPLKLTMLRSIHKLERFVSASPHCYAFEDDF